jgi:hypothetical protein
MACPFRSLTELDVDQVGLRQGKDVHTLASYAEWKRASNAMFPAGPRQWYERLRIKTQVQPKRGAGRWR